jgi:predicted ribosome quality control (RQC) complex YloA/Tae2 family protein
MPFDGIFTNCIAKELDHILKGAVIERVYQPEKDEVTMQLRTQKDRVRLVISANSTYPRIHLTTQSKKNPETAPSFCMLLRKHLIGGRIMEVTCFDYERIVVLHIQTMDEMGDTVVKKLVAEIMGKWSNIILTNKDDVILDAIKHVDEEVNRVREIMPARPYRMPPRQNKTLIDDFDPGAFTEQQGKLSCEKTLLEYIKGFSPLLSREVCYRGNIDPKKPFSACTPLEKARLAEEAERIKNEIKKGQYAFCIAYTPDDPPSPLDFHCFLLTQMASLKEFPSANEMLDEFFTDKDKSNRLVQKKSHLVKILHNNMDRCEKKQALYEQQIRDTADRETWRLYGELLTANIHALKTGMKAARVLNYYAEEEQYVEIPLDENKSPAHNAQMYYKRYQKEKAKYEYSLKQMEETTSELEYLKSVEQMLEASTDDAVIDEIQWELIENGYIKETKAKKKSKTTTETKPYRFFSSDGLRIYVGKNNKQNDQLTLKTAQANDIWLHTQKIPGSHVIIKKDYGEIPSSTVYEAAVLAAWHSKAKHSGNVPVDYTKVKNVKKPKGAKPGMVIYTDYKTLYVNPDAKVIEKLKQNQEG